MARKAKTPSAPPGAPLFMATYGDMVTLVLCFFVLLFAMSSIDAGKFKKALISLRGSLGVLPRDNAAADPFAASSETETASEAAGPQGAGMDTQQVAYMLNNYLRTEGFDEAIRVTVTQRGISVSIADQFLFETGRAELKQEGQRVLFKIATLVRDAVPAIAVEGHTDSVPLRGGIYRDNWGLSSARAATVASYLETGGGVNPQKLQAVGYASARPRVPNDTPEHRTLNRRVDLVFLSQYPK